MIVRPRVNPEVLLLKTSGISKITKNGLLLEQSGR